MVVVVVGALLPATVTASAAPVLRVGDNDGWVLGVDYEDWAKRNTLFVGDVLEFVYSKDDPTVDVRQVQQADFKACTVPSGALTMQSGDDKIHFVYPQQYYFICGSMDYCKSGMKLNVTMLSLP